MAKSSHICFLRCILVAALLTCFAHTQAQVKKIDSLVQVSQMATDDTLKVNLLNDISSQYYKAGNFNASFDFANKAKQLAETLKWETGLAPSYRNLADASSEKHAYNEAVRFYDLAAAIYKKTNNQKGLAACYNNQAIIYNSTGEFTRAIDQYKKAALINEASGNKNWLANNYLNMAGVLGYQGYRSEALSYYNKALSMKIEMDDIVAISTIYLGLGNFYKNDGNYYEALSCYKKALEMKQKLANAGGMAQGFLGIGHIYLLQGNYDDALDNYNIALGKYQVIDDKSGVSRTLASIGTMYAESRNYNEALKNYTVSLTMRKELGEMPGISGLLGNMGGIYSEQKNYDLAFQYFNESIVIKEKIGEKVNLPSAYQNLGSLYAVQNKHDKAISWFKKSFLLANELNAIVNKKVAAKCLFQSYANENKTDSALAWLSCMKNAITTELNTNYFALPEREKELYFATMERDYGWYYDFAIENQKRYPTLTDTAYNLALTNKGLGLKSASAMRNSILSSNDTSLIHAYSAWCDLRICIARLSQTGTNVHELELKAAEMEKELVKKSAVFSNFSQVRNTTWPNVQRALGANEAAIEFVQYTSPVDTSQIPFYGAIIITKKSNHPFFIYLCNENELKAILGPVQGHNLEFVSTVYGNSNQPQTALYEKTWKPLEQYLGNIHTIYYSPAGLLHKISFAGIQLDSKKFLCDKYNLNCLTSTGNLAHNNTNALQKNSQVELIGGINFSGPETKNTIWKYLPGTLTETKRIEQILSGKNFNVNITTGDAATEKRFKETASTANLVHIATHGFFFPDPEQTKKITIEKTTKIDSIVFRGTTSYMHWSFVNNKNPLMRSGLVLAGANNIWELDSPATDDDGILTAQEVANLDMRQTRLVVLSACETGLGDIKGSEGVYGLQRAFKIAGAQYLVMSLWQVPDKETDEFMELFYTWLTKTKNIKTAFRKAQIAMRKKYDPYYWAAFVLVE
jgi:CHAT domain-containing protein/tetratricopeptide (TPR) repeat protein